MEILRSIEFWELVSQVSFWTLIVASVLAVISVIRYGKIQRRGPMSEAHREPAPTPLRVQAPPAIDRTEDDEDEWSLFPDEIDLEEPVEETAETVPKPIESAVMEPQKVGSVDRGWHLDKTKKVKKNECS